MSGLIEPVEWRRLPLHPYERYEVSSDGDIRNGNRILGGQLDKDGYHSVVLSHNSTTARFRVHRLVCMAFHGLPSSPDLQAAHCNGNHRDNRPSNLRWATFRENVEDRMRHGKMRGEAHANAKLSEEQVLAIRDLSARGVRAPALAQQFGINRSTVGEIVRREKWKHLPERLTNLDKLIQGIERASEPDRALNAELLRQLGWTQDGRDAFSPDGSRALSVPDYLGSLDAAMTLVPNGLHWSVGFDTQGNRALISKSGSMKVETGKAATPALALCAAALRARETTPSIKGDVS